MVLARDCDASALLSSTSFVTHGGRPKLVVPHGGSRGVDSNRGPRRTHGLFALIDLRLDLLAGEGRHLVGGDGPEDVLLKGAKPDTANACSGDMADLCGVGLGSGRGECFVLLLHTGLLCVAVAHTPRKGCMDFGCLCCLRKVGLKAKKKPKKKTKKRTTYTSRLSCQRQLQQHIAG